MNRPIVGVTGLNATDNPGPGVPVIRALRADPAFHGSIVGLAYDAFDPGLYAEGLLDAAFLVPYPSAGRDAWLDRLAYIRERVGLDVLIPTLDSELPGLVGQEPALEAMGIRTFMPTREQYDMRAKSRLDALRTDHGIPVPRSEVLTDPSRLYTIHHELGFPLVVKGVFYGAEIARSVDEAVAAFHRMAAKWGLPVIVQRFVPGDEYNVTAVGDGEGGLVGAVPMKKLVITDNGKGWAGVTIADPGLLDLTRQIMAALRWRGPCEVEVRRDPKGGLHLLEINPRFPAWCDLTQGAGQNLPLAVVQLAQGEPVTALPPYRVGTAFVRISLNQIVPISALEGISTAGEILGGAA
ncbi:MAG TPA: ATP-grasp domain-containing protein [Myxococcota bacterium]|nr:ATP-grasp domain-containing protein [Myxococcota bacterium]